jgi:hypothetical protein
VKEAALQNSRHTFLSFTSLAMQSIDAFAFYRIELTPKPHHALLITEQQLFLDHELTASREQQHQRVLNDRFRHHQRYHFFLPSTDLFTAANATVFFHLFNVTSTVRFLNFCHG